MDKQYLISFLATMQGDKMVVTQLRQIEQTQGKVTKSTDKASKATKTYAQTMGVLVKRALLVIPVWLLLRSVFMGVIRLIGSMVEGYLDLEDGLARIQTVVHGTAEVIASQMVMIKNQIKDVATKTRIPLKELAETFYFLKTASLTTAEAMSAFEHTVDAMTGTGIKGKEMARAVAGVYNTMGKAILEGASASEKFQKIADILTYTYATQDVQMNELIQGYTKLAPFIAGLSDSFSDLVTMIGWLNTKMLRAGRTGRLTARAFLQITKNASKLAKIFGVTFDPNEPLNFMKIMGDINAKLKIQGKLTAQQTEALRRVFATRALTPVQLIIQDYDDLVEAQKLAVEEADNFAKKMAELKMDTVRGQMERMANITKVLFEDMLSAHLGAGDMAEGMKLLAEGLENSRDLAEGLGLALRFIGVNLSTLALQFKEMTKEPLTFILHTGAWSNYFKAIADAKLEYKSWGQLVDEREAKLKEYADNAETEKEKQLKLQQIELKQQDELLAGEKLRGAELKHEIAILKIMGATAKEIAMFRIESLEIERMTMTDAEYRVQQQLRLNSLIQVELKAKQEVRKVMQKLYVDYIEAGQVGDDARKDEIRSLMNALTFDPKTMQIWWRTATDNWREMIIENWKLLTKAQQDALREYWEATGQVPPLPIAPTEIFEQKFGEDIPTTFWESWIEKMESTGAMDTFRKKFLGILEEATIRASAGEGLSPDGTTRENAEMVKRINTRVSEQMAERERLVKAGHLPRGAVGKDKWTKSQITIERIEVTAEGVTPEAIAEAVKEEVKERLESDETIRKIRPKL